MNQKKLTMVNRVIERTQKYKLFEDEDCPCCHKNNNFEILRIDGVEYLQCTFCGVQLKEVSD